MLQQKDPRKLNNNILMKSRIRLHLIRMCKQVASVADPDLGSGIGCLFDPWIRDPGLGAFLTLGSGMGESQHPDPGSGMNNPDNIF